VNIFYRFKEIFSLDLRALALLRIGLAWLILLDLSIRATDLRAFYSDEGIMPLKVLFTYAWHPGNFSLHTISGLWQVQAFLFLFAAFCALMLLIGYKTFLFSSLSWLLLLSLHNRNPLILQGGDDLFRMMLFWGIFLPWNKFYSIDSYFKDRPEKTSYAGIAGAGYLLQLLFVYFFAALLKTSPEWRSEGTALYYALSLDQIVFPFGKIIYPYGELLKFLTITVWWLELLAPVLFLIPYRNALFRKIGIMLIASLHIGISMTLFVGLFYLIGLITLLGILPKDWMNYIDQKLDVVKEILSYYLEKMRSLRLKIFPKAVEYSKVKFRPLSLFQSTALSSVIIYVFLFNWYTLEIPVFKRIEYVDIPGQFLKFKQKWGMFSPGVFKDDGWFILEGTTESGEKIDINRNGTTVDYSKPELAVFLFKNDRWRKYGENFIYINNSYARPFYAEFMFKEWNKNKPEKRIKDLKILYMLERTLPDYQIPEITIEELAYVKD
jgi:hypothetical protein